MLTPQQMKLGVSQAPRALDHKRKISGGEETGGRTKPLVSSSPEVTARPPSNAASSSSIGIKRPHGEEHQSRAAPTDRIRAGPSTAGPVRGQSSVGQKRPLEAVHEARPPPAARRDEQTRAEKDLRALEKRKKAASSNPFIKPSRPV